MGITKPTSIDTWWKTIDIPSLQIASTRYQKAKGLYKTARKENTPKAWKNAKEAYKAVIKIMKIDSATFVEYAEICRSFGDYDESIKYLIKAIELKDDRPKFLKSDQSFLRSKLFQIYFEKNDYESAVKELKNITKKKMLYQLIPSCLKIIEINPDFEKNIEKKFSEYEIDFKNKTNFDEIISLPILKFSRHQELAELVLLFLYIFNGALEGSIKNQITANIKITKEVLVLLHDAKYIEHRRIYGYNLFTLSDRGIEVAKSIETGIKESLKDLQNKKKGSDLTTLIKFSEEQNRKILDWHENAESEREKLYNFSDNNQ